MEKALRGPVVAFVSVLALLGAADAATAAGIPSRTATGESRAMHSTGPEEAAPAGWAPAGVFTKRSTCKKIGKWYVQQGKATDYTCVTIPMKKRRVTLLWIKLP
ncbi:hypothetical protein C8E97_4409 [Saccharothrix australiensis]|uniref:Uncharacterized protein n=2 Tax=Saccharothrix australiensis TaxID=2072 RepID=A0A495W304_9PSEU|nr:hypothetical protein C8E97_4409 [Saccharothrix australiensis]